MIEIQNLGNFSVSSFEQAREDYRVAYANYLGNKSEENRLAVKLAETNIMQILEDDAWKSSITLSNALDSREMSGNVWEAIDDNIKSSYELQTNNVYGDRYVTYNSSNDLALGGIKVELVELLKSGDTENGETQIVRAQTETKDDGSYTFTSYIAGDYVVRFVYGNENEVIYSKVTKNTSENQEDADFLPINGQYYQSTKANPETNTVKYWYTNNSDRNGKGEIGTDANASANSEVRYSDAYDDSYSRLTQMNAVIENVETLPGGTAQTSSDIAYDGNIEIEAIRHTDPIYSYTSTMNIEIEYVRPACKGNQSWNYYNYGISNVDFGVTPRSYNDVNVSRYVSNITLYAEGTDTPLIYANFDENGKIDEETLIGKEYVGDSLDAVVSYKDGLIHIDYEQIIEQRSHLEITYAVIVSNDSEYDAENGVYDTIKYIYKDGNIVGVVYYQENTDKLINYENGAIIYHNTLNDFNYTDGLAGEYRNQNIKRNDDANGIARNTRLSNYSVITGFDEGEAQIITSKVENIVDYPNDPLDFAKTNYKGESINEGWVETEPSEFISSRENYKIEEDTETNTLINKLIGTYEDENSLMRQSHILRATDESGLYTPLKPGETAETTLCLQHILSTTSVEIEANETGSKEQDLKALDEEYSNFIEITELSNIAGKVVDMEGYDINGTYSSETSKVLNISDIETDESMEVEVGNNTETRRVSTFKTDSEAWHYTPTLSTGKSQTTSITPPAGLSGTDRIFTYAGITLVVLVIFAGGIILIKKYAIKPKE